VPLPQPFFVMGFFKIESQELFVQTGFKWQLLISASLLAKIYRCEPLVPGLAVFSIPWWFTYSCRECRGNGRPSCRQQDEKGYIIFAAGDSSWKGCSLLLFNEGTSQLLSGNWCYCMWPLSPKCKLNGARSTEVLNPLSKVSSWWTFPFHFAEVGVQGLPRASASPVW
jgi:hypothetical protein